MEKKDNVPLKISSISELHDILQLPKPLHPLVSLVDNTKMKVNKEMLKRSFTLDFYKISYKYSTNGKMGYGQGYYDFNEGGMMFTAPGQVLSTEENAEYSGYTLLVHPDFIRSYPLARNIKNFGFFSYDTNEALHLSDQEKTTITGLLDNIRYELNTAIDEVSQDVIISYIEVLLNYSNRFYKRQFITRKAVNHDLLTKMDTVLEDYFNKQETLNKGLPTVEFLASTLNLSPHYLSDMLRNLTGLNAQQHIHEKLIEKAKEYLTTTGFSVSEVAYALGFEHPQSFNKLFKKKTDKTPLSYRQSFN
ncbi:Methylphosphotriester-DNA--protein-cysteine S-methyltransferase [Chryseobacterium gleum]|jgi:AraC-like DNA-binding protein|uniref:Methylphosphotriester-DNA--protein-cysteine S-methyltransferase n=2 Tax=Chryseobacterium gleum TaxID=250 RepID=A0A3S4PC46_CHRGE|nr:helix-turn-helix transcriptional regulator [Chryseobacterium gleum]EFK35013.1 transcriptional regulator, AraC family [Chryseobacterium gleum ATCC 35910]MCD9616117.1 helix-turn-helix transcriptional regulator [Chryseobacterium gleum]MCE4064273.1 helix-turn-helix transcriptional regulator [Chryseobacterium gleum]QQY30819.1 helix-turn-helix transcriptional regulator [Chryseobacterium gleum]VEE04820.1 Methylphosphotriester-DNA--protein-cysteine S-methyltransferase [Chryseobacterium gleum]